MSNYRRVGGPPCSQEKIRELFDYSPVSGELFWKIGRSGIHVGQRVGDNTPSGRRVMINSKMYRVCWIVLFWNNGRWPRGSPEEVVHHINGNSFDDRLDNLQIVTKSYDTHNRKTSVNNTSGYQGVSWQPSSNKWIAYINTSNKRITIGRFDTLSEAVEARQMAETRLWERRDE